MDRLKEILNNAATLDADELMREIYKDKKFHEFILDLNRINQLFEEGIDSDGVKLGKYADSTTTKTFTFKGDSQVKKAGGDIFLFDTGDFYESFKLKVQKTAIEITADAQKEDTNLFDDFGNDIVGLTEESKQILSDIFAERLIPLIREHILR